jgi:hypothetical protein
MHRDTGRGRKPCLNMGGSFPARAHGFDEKLTVPFHTTGRFGSHYEGISPLARRQQGPRHARHDLCDTAAHWFHTGSRIGCQTLMEGHSDAPGSDIVLAGH